MKDVKYGRDLVRYFDIIADVSYKPEVREPDGSPTYKLMLDLDEERGFYLQVWAWRLDTFTGKREMGKGGRAYLSDTMTDSELVQAAFGLFKAYEEHECREGFTWAGKRIYGPHISIRALALAADRLDASGVS